MINLIKILILITSFGLVSGESNNSFKASYYHDKFHGRRTASGDIFKQTKYTCASNFYNLGDSVKVINIENNKSVNVLVNDRISIKYSDRIDLSKTAFKEIGDLKSGILPVTVEKI